MPNVAFDGICTGNGLANISIRGATVAGSIRSIDPTVGVFVYGMYLGVNYGVVLDMPDIEVVAVLRGPQGPLLECNVTGATVTNVFAARAVHHESISGIDSTTERVSRLDVYRPRTGQRRTALFRRHRQAATSRMS